ncbi:hypothetical protein, conserved [Eimeria tenella]|uniref:Uncharacterized protein n=1 Tax=Eimeria tenella TaxID=5802 RepID=U6KN12_EIMTE|nr:hypothetical protein, conserved [Eimeria tenella]CDJ39381.1 hypothetical protein, conserved [Eimeria tenella]|eukprot:XP_013230136.1 hypothetical protein, conserved [Eimeria tenella]
MGEVGSTSVYFSSETPAAEPSVEDFAFQSVAKENSRDLFLALFKFNLPKAFEEVHVDAETHTFAALSSSLRPPGLLLSLHKSILAAAFMNGFIVFLWRRNCKSLRSVLVHIFASTSLPVFVGGCSATNLLETLLSFGLAAPETLAAKNLNCIFPFLICMQEAAAPPCSLWPQEAPSFAEKAEFNKRLYENLTGAQLALALINSSRIPLCCSTGSSAAALPAAASHSLNSDSSKQPLAAAAAAAAAAPHNKRARTAAAATKGLAALAPPASSSGSSSSSSKLKYENFFKKAEGVLRYSLSSCKRLVVAAVQVPEICIAAELSEDTQLLLGLQEMQVKKTALWSKVLQKDPEAELREDLQQQARLLLQAFVLSHSARSMWQFAAKEIQISFQDFSYQRTSLSKLFPQVALWQEEVLLNSLVARNAKASQKKQQEPPDSDCFEGAVYAAINKTKSDLTLRILSETRELLLQQQQQIPLVAFWENVFVAEESSELQDETAQQLAGCISRAWHQTFPNSSGVFTLHQFITEDLSRLSLSHLT